MTSTTSKQPDLDWSQIRETVRLLAVSVAQVESGMKAGDESVDRLIHSFTRMVDDLSAVQQLLSTFEPSQQRDQALLHCTATQNNVQSSIIAFQFYDRLQQCLQQVSIGLRGLSAIIESPQRLYNPMEWYAFQEEIRSRYTTESQKIMFDAIHQGKSIDEAIALAAGVDTKPDDDDVELF